jgi:HlyD family secretion protein
MIVAGVVAVVLIGSGYWYHLSTQRTVPAGILSGNGRLEADEIQIAAKYAGRVAQIDFQEGDLVKAGQVLARMDTKETEAAERAAVAQVSAREKDGEAARSEIGRRQAALELANSELARGITLVATNAVSQQRVEQLTAAQKSAQDSLAAARSQADAADAATASAKAEDERLLHVIADGTLTASKPGRILYKLADVGETLPAGGSVATLLDLSNVYMTLFLPSDLAARVPMNASSRIVLDAAPNRSVPGNVSYVSPQAQFTPKQVEVQSERERMMYRVKVRIPDALIQKFIDVVKTGVTGVAYVKADSKAQWPSWLDSDLTTGADAK